MIVVCSPTPFSSLLLPLLPRPPVRPSPWSLVLLIEFAHAQYINVYVFVIILVILAMYVAVIYDVECRRSAVLCVAHELTDI